MNSKEIAFIILLLFAVMFFADIVSSLRIPSPYDGYVAVGGTVIIGAIFINWYQKKRF